MDFSNLRVMRKNSIPVSRLLEHMTHDLDSRLIAGYQGTDRPVYTWDVNRPGLALTGYLEYFANDRVQILGNTEIHYMERLSSAELSSRIANMFAFEIPVFMLSRNLPPPAIFLDMCNRNGVPVLCSSMSTDEVISRIILFLAQEFAPETRLHGTAVDVYGVGCIIVGKPGIGKSESALELVERGHRLVADDLIELKRLREDYLHAQTNEIAKHHMEIRGLGFIDIRSVFGVGHVRNFKRIGLVVELVAWVPDAEYDHTGLQEEFVEILGVRIPHLRVPVCPGRNIAIVIEVAALNQRLKELGIHSAKTLNDEIVRRNREQAQRRK